MEKKLTPEEKQLIEREFFAQQDKMMRRRNFAYKTFLVGISCGIIGGALRGFHLLTFAYPVLIIIWFFCVMLYVGGGIFPTTLRKDLDMRWHFNPWREALLNLPESKTIIEAVALLTAPYFARMLALFIYLAFK
ncbi:hypothetical protein QEH59_18480 [Coraliomargarita sp. SDUM461004]|uniref:Uncharacterized protein n=1 Tax=Thalassobacterium sedimentorum TaxID=3041258 RepID=A0ABU1ANQ6_9BACT|nr:hypothetical protein [Coraliomargarita sp. SDUM461004]MDQ8196422.1 hypothetical protein [Coraliomargarita sp. SDUM461004]